MYFSSYSSKKGGFVQRLALASSARTQHARHIPHLRRILGIDPGLATVGLGVVESDVRGEIKAVDWLTITTAAGISASERLAEIKNDLSRYIEKMKPDLAVVERLYFSKNEKTAFAVAQARGVILLTLAEHALPFLEPNPLTLKSCIAGSGRADKAEVQDMLVRTLHLKEIPHPDDASDALALALFGAMQQQVIALS